MKTRKCLADANVKANGRSKKYPSSPLVGDNFQTEVYKEQMT